MLRIAKNKNPKARFIYGDILKLPFPAKSFDTIWCIAILHHLPTEKLREKALVEMKRVLKKNGVLMITVWNLLAQEKYAKYINPANRDGFIPWGQAKTTHRYYHAFTPRELADLIKKTGLKIHKKLANNRNIAFICHEKS